MIDIFVFGSNMAGRHGKGAALYAKRHYGAEYGVGDGPTGNAYAIPTKDAQMKIRLLADIERDIRLFVDYARGSPNGLFHLTPIGCGLAGYNRRQIWSILRDAGLPDNVVLTSTWINP